MKKLLTTLALSTLFLAGATHAQGVDPKLEWANKVVALQQGPELERMISQLAGVSTQELILHWEPRLQSNVPKAKQAKALDDLNVELKKYSDEVRVIIASKVAKVSSDALVPAYVEKFSLEELKQIAAFFESPAVKKYQSVAPDLGNAFVEKLIEAVRPEVSARAKVFDDSAVKIVGSGPDAPAGKAAPGAKPAKK